MPPGCSRRVIDGRRPGPLPRCRRSPGRRRDNLGTSPDPAAAGVGDAGGVEGDACGPGAGSPGARDADVRPYWSPYSRIPLVAAGQLELLLAETRRVLPQVRVPLLVVQGRRDWIIPRDSADEILRLAAGVPATMLWLQRSGHVATLDRDRAVLADAVTEFLRVHGLTRGEGGGAA